MFEILEQFALWSIVDIAVIATIIYHLIMLLRGTRAMQMIFGLLLLFGSLYLFSQFYPLNTIKWMMNKLYPSFIVVVVIIFQEDIRRVLSGMGKRTLIQSQDIHSSKWLFDELSRATASLAAKKMGALIALERNIVLDRYVDVGTVIDGKVSKELLEAIFHTTSPIHDGSVIIQNGRIKAAGCFLPLSYTDNINPNFGTRHRAAIGLSQETDAVILVVSEERGTITLAIDGKVFEGVEPKELRKRLRKLFALEEVIAESVEAPKNWKLYVDGAKNVISRLKK